MTQTLTPIANLGNEMLRTAATAMAEISPTSPGRDPIALAWIRGRMSDVEYAGETTSTFAEQRRLALTIVRCAAERGGQPDDIEMGLIHATMAGFQEVSTLEEQIGTWDRD